MAGWTADRQGSLAEAYAAARRAVTLDEFDGFLHSILGCASNSRRATPHTHPVDELVTVISGLSKLGMGEKADPSKTQSLPPGSFFYMAPKMPHYAFFDEETVIQISTIGPWSVTLREPG
jgi:uncharacterized RmlC-like cupin family protein